MDRRLLLAVALSVAVVIGYQEYLRIFYPEYAGSSSSSPTPTPALEQEETPTPTRQRADAELPPRAPLEKAGEQDRAAVPRPEADIRVETELFRARLSSRGGRLVSLRLKRYRTTVDPASSPLEMIRTGESGDYPLGLVLRGEEVWDDSAVSYEPSTRSLALEGGSSGTVVLEGEGPSGGTIRKEFRFGAGDYTFDVSVRLDPVPAGAREASLRWTQAEFPVEEGWGGRTHGTETLIGEDLIVFGEEELARGVVAPDPREPRAEGSVRWVGFFDSYFLSALFPEEASNPRLWAKFDEGKLSTELLVPLPSDGPATVPFRVFSGPKEIEILERVGYGLARALDLGWFSLVAEPMLRVLKFFHDYTGNYGVDIILLTILIKVLFIPLTQKSFKSMQDLQRIQPEMKKLQEKYKDDRETLNKELMELYRRHKVNPLGGCLPILLQMPVFIGLYNALFYAVELRHAPFFLWINDLSAPDRLPAVPSPPLAEIAGIDIRIPVLTLLMGASMLVQQRMTPASGDPMQQRMMMLMPIVFTVMFVSFPSGLVLYWFVNNILTIAQQMTLQKRR